MATKQYHKEYRKKWYLENREYELQKSREYYRKNKDALKLKAYLRKQTVI